MQTRICLKQKQFLLDLDEDLLTSTKIDKFLKSVVNSKRILLD